MLSGIIMVGQLRSAVTRQYGPEMIGKQASERQRTNVNVVTSIVLYRVHLKKTADETKPQLLNTEYSTVYQV